ncbi:MAG: DUF1080 domain-containing protein [Phycisphaerae bacterium]|jgi:hypothetical protein
MSQATFRQAAILVASVLLVSVPSLQAADAKAPAVGRWDITLGEGPTPCWLEVKPRDGGFAGRFLMVAGSVFDLKQLKVEGDKIEFDAGGGNVFTGTVRGDAIEGTFGKNARKWTARRFVPKVNVLGRWVFEGDASTDLILRERNGNIRGRLMEGGTPQRVRDVKLEGYRLELVAGERPLTAAVKGDVLEGTVGDKKFKAVRQREWGEPIELFNGKDLEGWKPLGDPNNFKWKVVDGILHCEGQSANIVSERKFDDFKLHVEFRTGPHSNSGVYLRGRYEIQVATTDDGRPSSGSCGALYSRAVPSRNAGKPPGEWQTFDITLIDHYVTVVWNGQTVHDNIEIEGITGGAIDSHENEPGPIYLQGDHSAIDYRKITLTPAR